MNIIVLINKARVFYNCVTIYYYHYYKMRLLLLIVIILLLLLFENRVNEFKILFSF